MKKIRSVRPFCHAGLMAALLLSGAVTTRAASTWHVATTGSDSNTGTGWDQPWASISNAVTNATAGDTILVATGTYGITNEILVNKGVAILGQGLRDETIVERVGTQTNRIFKITHADALIANLTIQRGYVSDPGANGGLGALNGGAGIFMTDGTVSNCVVTANTNRQASDSSGYPWGGGVSMSGGTLWGCTISSNAAFGYGTYGLGVYMSGGTIRDSQVINNRSRSGNDQNFGAGICMMTGGTVTNTDIIGNGFNGAGGASKIGGVYYGAGTLVDCRILSNASPNVAVYNGMVLRNCTIGFALTSPWAAYANVQMVRGTLTNCTIFSGGPSVNGVSFAGSYNLVVDCVISNEATGAFLYGTGAKSNLVLQGTVYNSGVNIGNALGASTNQALVTGLGSSWNLGGKIMTVGFATSAGNEMTVTDSGRLDNVGALNIIGIRNSVVVSNGASLTGTNVILGATGANGNTFDADEADIAVFGLTVGSSSSSNTVTLRNNTTWDLRNGLLTWGAGLGKDNALNVDESSSIVNAGGLSLNDSGRTVYLTNGLLNDMDVQFSGGALNIGTGPNLAPVALVMEDYTLNPSGNTQGGASGVGLAGSHNNSLSILGNSLWNGGNQTLTIGAAGGTGNVLRLDGQGIEGGARMTNINAIAFGALQNMLIVTNGGQLFSVNIPVIGSLGAANSNRCIIAGGGPAGAASTWDLGNAGYLYVQGAGGAATSLDNQLIVDGAGVSGGAIVKNFGELRMGNGSGQDNQVIIRNGGQMFAGNCTLGFQSSSNNSISVIGGAATSRFSLATTFYVQNLNRLLVDGEGTEDSALVSAGGTLVVSGGAALTITNQGRVNVAALTMNSGASNSIVVSTGGKFYQASGAGSVGNAAGVFKNSVLVRDAGSLWDLGNQNLTLGIATSTNNTLVIIDGGAVDRVNTLTVAGAFNSLTLSGGTLGAASTTYTNGQFNVGDGVQAAALKGLGGTLTFNSGLLVRSNSVLTGVGTVSGANAGVVIPEGAAVNPGLNGAGTLAIGGSNLTWDAGGSYRCDVTNLNLGFGWGWDMLNVAGQVIFTGGAPGSFIKMDSKGVAAAGFDPARNYRLKILSYGGLTDFDPEAVTLDTSVFLPSGYDWYLLNTNNAFWLAYDGTAPDGDATLVWKVPSNGNWSAGGNWTGEVAPDAGGDAAHVVAFGDDGTPYNSVNDLAGSFLLNKLVLSNLSGKTNIIRGNPLAFTVNAGAPPRLEYQSGAGGFVVSNALALSDPAIFGGEGGGLLVLASNVTGGQPLIKEGAWTLALAASNSFADPVVVTNGGLIRLDHNQALGTNSLLVTGNGTLQTTAAYTLGNGSVLRQARVAGAGSMWTNDAVLNVTANGQLTVEDGGRLTLVKGFTVNNSSALPYGLAITNNGLMTYSNISTIGGSSSSNTMLISGSGSTLLGPGDGGGVHHITLGAAGNAGNTLLVQDSGTFTNARLYMNGSSRLVVTNSGRFYSTSFSLMGNSTASVIGGTDVTSVLGATIINMHGQGTRIDVDGLDVDGSAWVIAPVTVGQSAGDHNNRLRVMNKGRITALGGSSTLSIGAVGCTNNAVEIVQGGYGKFAAGPGYYGIGGGNRANDNYMLVEDAGSVLELANIGGYRWELGFGNNAASSNFNSQLRVRNNGLMTNACILSVASFVTGTNVYNSGILVSESGKVYSSANCEVGLVGGVTGNYVKVTDPGSYWSMGGYTSAFGHVRGGSTNNFLMITQGGTLENIGNLVVHSNNQVHLYGGTLGLIRAGISNGLPLIAGDGAQPATLKAQGGLLSLPAGLVITNNALLTGRGTIQATTTVYGAFSPGAAIGALTNNGGFVLKPGAITTVELNAYTAPGSGWDLLAVTNGALELNGALSVMLTGGFMPTNTQSFVIMTNLGPLSVSGSFANAAFGTVPAYTVAGGKPDGFFTVMMSDKSVVLKSFSPVKPNPGAIIVIR